MVISSLGLVHTWVAINVTSTSHRVLNVLEVGWKIVVLIWHIPFLRGISAIRQLEVGEVWPCDGLMDLA